MLSTQDCTFLYQKILDSGNICIAVELALQYAEQRHPNIINEIPGRNIRLKKKMYKQAIVYDDFIHKTFPNLRNISIHKKNKSLFQTPIKISKRNQQNIDKKNESKHAYHFRPSTLQARKSRLKKDIQSINNIQDDISESSNSQLSDDSEWVPSVHSDDE